MKFLLPIILLSILQNVFGEEIPKESNNYDDELSYLEQINMNLSCNHWDSCMADQEDDPPVPEYGYKCSCHSQCWEFGTCCIDSPHKVKPPIQKCRRAGIANHANLYYMVDRCPDNTNTDSLWKNQCEKEWNEEDDILMLCPVTSLDTSRTYKNYYCFKCHEITNNYVSWNHSVDSFDTVSGDMNDLNVSYNQEQNSWMAILDENDLSFPVNLSFQFSDDLEGEPFSCDLDMIEDCPDTWTDRRVREKCISYTAAVYQEFSSYKNVHCALCNSVPLDALSCKSSPVNATTSIKKNAFTYLLHINDEKCEEGHIWNPFSKKCQKMSCAVPGHIIMNGRCVPS